PVADEQWGASGDAVDGVGAGYLHEGSVRELRHAGIRAGCGAVDVVVVDVEGDTAPGLVVSAVVLMDSLMVCPIGGRYRRIAGGLLAVPVGDPDVVRFGEAAAVLRDQVNDSGASAAVHAGQIAVGV